MSRVQFFQKHSSFCRFISIRKGNPSRTFFISEVVMVVPNFRKRNEAISHPNQHTNENPAKCVLNAAISFVNILEIILAETVQKKHSELHSQASFTSKTFKKRKLSFLFELVIYTFAEIWNFSYFYRPPYLHLRGNF